MMIAVVLSANVRKMVRDQVLVRKPVGIEAAGSMNLLFTDKTGTLTEGKMSVVSLLFAGGESFSDLSALRRRCGSAVSDLLALGLRGGGATLDAENRPVGGSATERALLAFAAGEAIPPGSTLTSTLPFDSARKLSAVSWRVSGKPVTVLLGAPERILPFVRGAMTPDGGIAPRFSRRFVEAELKRMNAGSGRGLAIAVSTDGTPAPLLADGVRGDFLLVGVLELSDPIRADAPGAVRDLHGAGIQVVMVTGDSRETGAGDRRAVRHSRRGLRCDPDRRRNGGDVRSAIEGTASAPCGGGAGASDRQEPSGSPCAGIGQGHGHDGGRHQ